MASLSHTSEPSLSESSLSAPSLTALLAGKRVLLGVSAGIAAYKSALIVRLLKQAGLPAQVIGEPPLFDVVFTDQPIRDYRDTLRGDKAMLGRFNQALRARGIMKGESKYYISLALTQADIDHTITTLGWQTRVMSAIEDWSQQLAR